MKIYYDYEDDKRIFIGEADTLDEASKIRDKFLKENYGREVYYHRYWFSDKQELINDFGSHTKFIIFTDLTVEDLKKLPH